MIARKLIAWYHDNKRDLPWRDTKDPYKVWLSEVILQQTRVAQGLPYYLKFVEAFPTVFDLAKAPGQKVLKLWQGLGYYSRARNLHTAAKQVVKEHKGVFPSTFEGLKKLKGVGDYTAAAISSFCFNKPHAVVDGNVFRVLSRLHAIETPIDSVAGKKQFTELANKLLDKKDPGSFNQGIMEFGAQHCAPANPNCAACIFKSDCAAHATGTVKKFPVKAGKQKITTRYFEYFYVAQKSKTWIQKRTGADIWKGLYQLPALEFSSKAKKNTVLSTFNNQILEKKGKFEVKGVSAVKKHQLSHQQIVARFWHINLSNTGLSAAYRQIDVKNLKKYPFPVLIGNHLREITIFE